MSFSITPKYLIDSSDFTVSSFIVRSTLLFSLPMSSFDSKCQSRLIIIFNYDTNMSEFAYNKKHSTWCRVSIELTRYEFAVRFTHKDGTIDVFNLDIEK